MDKQLSEIIDLAIQREEEAYDFYMDIFNKLEDTSTKDTVEFIAKEEKKIRKNPAARVTELLRKVFGSL